MLAALGLPARWPRALVILLAAHAVPLALWLSPPGRVALGSDLGAGALILALAAGALVGVAATARG